MMAVYSKGLLLLAVAVAAASDPALQTSSSHAGPAVRNASSSLAETGRKPLWVHVDTWLGVAHSYSLVGQHLALALAALPGTRVSVGESQPLYRPSWPRSTHAMGSAATRQLLGMQHDLMNASSACPDILFRATFPLSTTRPAHCPHTVLLLHATAEQGRLVDVAQAEAPPFQPWHAWHSAIAPGAVVTPSWWSWGAFFAAGVPAAVVPHGVQTPHLHPHAEQPQRRHECLTLLSVGAMTHNKGIAAVMAAAERVLGGVPANLRPCVRLLLKAPSELYTAAQARVQAAAKQASVSALTVHFSGGLLDPAAMRALVASADVYVAAFRSEGFGLPLLEAAAAGTPIVTTRAPPATEFLNDSSALLFNASLVRRPAPSSLFPASCPRQGAGDCGSIAEFEPVADSLCQVLTTAIAGAAWARAGPAGQNACGTPDATPWAALACALCDHDTGCAKSAWRRLQAVTRGARRVAERHSWSSAARHMLLLARSLAPPSQH